MLAASSDSVQSVVDEQAQQNEAALYAALLQQLASSNLDDQQKLMSALPDSTEIRPLPGFVIKTLTGPPLSDDSTTEPSKFPADCKIFINICHSPHLPSPPMATDEEIQQALEEQDNSRYRVPLSLSPPREDTDKGNIQ